MSCCDFGSRIRPSGGCIPHPTHFLCSNTHTISYTYKILLKIWVRVSMQVVSQPHPDFFYLVQELLPVAVAFLVMTSCVVLICTFTFGLDRDLSKSSML